MEPPLRVAQALMQHLALLLSALRQILQEFRFIQSAAFAASIGHERPRQQELQQQLTAAVLAAAHAKGVSRASYYEECGRPVPAKLPLHFKLIEANIKEFVGEPCAVASAS